MNEKDFIQRINTHLNFDKEPPEQLAEAFQLWFYSLPKYTKIVERKYIGGGNFTSFSRSNLKFKNALRAPEIEADRFLFQVIPDVFEESDLSALSSLIIQTKNEIDGIMPDMLTALKKDICSMFGYNNEDDIWRVLMVWYSQLPERTRNHCFQNGEERLFKTIMSGGNDISDFCVLLKGTAPEVFEENTPALFYQALINHKAMIESYGKATHRKNSDTYSIRLGKRELKTFAKTHHISSPGKLMLNELSTVVSEYGQAISPNEKRQILLNVLEGINGMTETRATD